MDGIWSLDLLSSVSLPFTVVWSEEDGPVLLLDSGIGDMEVMEAGLAVEVLEEEEEVEEEMVVSLFLQFLLRKALILFVVDCGGGGD